MYEDFHCLALGEKAELVLKKGQHLLTTDFYGASIKLYFFKRRFMEVYYHPVTDKIMRVSLANAEDLNKHLHRIKIDVLFS
jgi:hypothetical protein